MDIFTKIYISGTSIEVKLHDQSLGVTVTNFDEYFRKKSNISQNIFWIWFQEDFKKYLTFHVTNYFIKTKNQVELSDPLQFWEYLENIYFHRSNWVPQNSEQWTSYDRNCDQKPNFPIYAVLKLLNIVPYLANHENIPSLDIHKNGFWRQFSEEVAYSYFTLTPKIPFSAQNNFMFRDLFLGCFSSNIYTEWQNKEKNEIENWFCVQPPYIFSCGCNVNTISKTCTLIQQMVNAIYFLAINKVFLCSNSDPCGTPCACTTIKTIQFQEQTNLFFF